jgi:HEAT repeat protein
MSLSRKTRVWLGIVSVLAGLALLFLAMDGFFGPRYQGRTARSWSRDLFSDNPTNRAAAREALLRLGPKAVPEVAHFLHARDWAGRQSLRASSARLPNPAGAWLVSRIGPPGAGSVRAEAALMLGEFGTNAASAVPQLVRALQDPDRAVVACAATALGRIGPPAVDRLVPLVKSTNTPVRHMAVYALGQAGPAAATAVPALLERLNDPDPDVRAAAGAALVQVGETATLAIMDALAGPDPGSVLTFTTNRNGLVRQLVPHLVDWLETGTPEQKAKAARVVDRLGLKNPRLHPEPR